MCTGCFLTIHRLEIAPVGAIYDRIISRFLCAIFYTSQSVHLCIVFRVNTLLGPNTAMTIVRHGKPVKKILDGQSTVVQAMFL